MPDLPDLSDHKLYWHPSRTDVILKRQAVPLTIELGLTSACNQNCIFCAFDYRAEVRSLPTTSVEQLPKSTGFPRSIHLGGDGDPTLHLHFNTIVQTLHEYGLEIGLTTNGTMREQIVKAAPYLTWVRFSINAGTEKEYKRIHQGKNSLKEVMDTVKATAEAMEDKVVGVQCLMLDQSVKSVEQLISTSLEKAKAHYVAFKPYSVHPQSFNRIAVNFPRDSLHSYGSDVILRTNFPRKTYTGCLAGLTAFWLIDSHGDVYPCAQFVGDKSWSPGNITHGYQGILGIERGLAMEHILSRLEELDCSTCRHPCRLDAANRYLHRIRNPHEHDNFL